MCALSGHLTINLKALADNYKLLDNRSSSSVETGAAVKASAYGTGITEAAPALYEAGCRTFFVATLGEAAALHDLIPEATIAVLNGFDPSLKTDYKAGNFIPVLNALKDIEEYAAYSKSEGMKMPAFLHFDTGMNRLGLQKNETEKLIQNKGILDTFEIKGIMSHFVASDEKGHPLNDQQFKTFKAITQNFQGVTASLCNSSGIFRSKEYHFDLTRPGVALYGANPTPETENPMYRVVNLDVPALQIRKAEAGDTAGYNATHRFEKEEMLVVVSLGYADGFLRSLSGKGKLFWKGYELPIRGRVSMDLTICSLANVPEDEYPTAGDHIEVLGENQSVDDLAKDAGTIGYEILTSLGPRYTRTYIRED